jgi:hypothetical protein
MEMLLFFGGNSEVGQKEIAIVNNTLSITGPSISNAGNLIPYLQIGAFVLWYAAGNGLALDLATHDVSSEVRHVVGREV